MTSQDRDLQGPIHFFQINGENSLRNGELRIPKSFVSKHWQGISNPLLLVLPNGAKWEMNWEERDVDVWLCNNWKKFAEFYSLDKWQFLMFKYEGKSQFEVRILGRSALEIEYPSLNGTFEAEKSGNSIEILDGISSRHSKRPKSPSSYSHSPKKKKINTKEEPKCYASQHARQKHGGGRGIFSKSEAINNEESLEDTESSSALQRAKAFSSESDNPWFYREMRPTYLQKYVLFIPGNYITAQQQKENKSATLWVTKERTWNVKFRRNHCNGQITLTTGWKSFAEDNNLKQGDVCVFEKTECRGVSFRVVIYRATQESTPLPSQAYGDGANRKKQTCVRNNFAERGREGTPKQCSKTNVFEGSKHRRYNSSKMSEDHFTLILKPYQLKHSAHIPFGFIKNYTHNAKCVTLRVGNRLWQVKLDSYPQHRYSRFSAGWRTFVTDCNLKAGDVCLFQLIEKENLVLEVRVSRCVD